MNDAPLDAKEHVGEARHVEQAGGGVLARGAQQDVIWLMTAQHVVNQIGGDRHLSPGLFLAGKAALDKPCNHGAIAKGALHQR